MTFDGPHRLILEKCLTNTAKALYAVLLWQLTERPLVVIAAGNKQAETLCQGMQTFFHLLVSGRERHEPQMLPALDLLPAQRMSPHAEILEERAAGLWRLATGGAPITVTPVGSALQRIEPPDFYRQLALTLRSGDEIPLEDLIAHLESIGYEKRDPVEMVGEYSVRGGILDVYSPESPKPVRVEMFGDQIDSIRRFEVESQRSVLKIPECTLLPLTEFQKSRGLLSELTEKLREAGVPARDLPLPGETLPGWELLAPLVRPRNGSLFDLYEKPIVILDEPEEIRAAAERFWKRLDDPERPGLCPPEKVFFHWEELAPVRPGAAQIELRELELGTAGLHIPTRPSMSFHGNMQVAIAEARSLVEGGSRVAFFAASAGEIERLADIFNEYAIPYQLGTDQSDGTPQYLAERAYLAGSVASIYLIRGGIERGTSSFPMQHWRSSDRRTCLRRRNWWRVEASRTWRRSPPKRSSSNPATTWCTRNTAWADSWDCVPSSRVKPGATTCCSNTRADSKLYVPLTHMDLVQRFRGAGEGAPQLDRMGGATWTRTKTRLACGTVSSAEAKNFSAMPPASSARSPEPLLTGT